MDGRTLPSLVDSIKQKTVPIWDLVSVVFMFSKKMGIRAWFLPCPGSSYALLLDQAHTSLTTEFNSSFFPNSIFCKILFHSSKSHFPGQTKYPGCITSQASVGWHFCPWGDLLGYSLVSVLCGDWKLPEQMQEDMPALGTQNPKAPTMFGRNRNTVYRESH